MIATRKSTSHSRLQIGVAALGSIGILTPFLPFTWSTSPLSVVVAPTSAPEFMYVPIALSFFLAIIVLIVQIRTVLFASFSRTEGIIAYGSSFIMAFATLAFTIWMFTTSQDGPGTFSEWLSVALPLMTIPLGVALVRWCWRHGVSPPITAITAMQSAYIANASFCLALFWPKWQVGAIVTVVTVAVYAAQIVLVIAAARAEHRLSHAFHS
jgi:hypothetical protein